MNHRLIPTIFYSCSSEKSANSQKMAEKNNNDIHVEIALKVMAKLKIEQRNGILAITIQENRSGNVDTMIIDCENKEMLEIYPYPTDDQGYFSNAADDTELHEKKYENFIITWKYLPSIGEMKAEPSKVSSGEAFCCKNLDPYKPRPTDKDQIFKQFLDKTGTLENYIFKVIRNNVGNF